MKLLAVIMLSLMSTMALANSPVIMLSFMPARVLAKSHSYNSSRVVPIPAPIPVPVLPHPTSGRSLQAIESDKQVIEAEQAKKKVPSPN